MTAVEVFASYAPKRRRDISPTFIEVRDGLLTVLGADYQPTHRADVPVSTETGAA